MKSDPKNARVRLIHMLEACDRTARLVEDRTREDLDADEMLRLALQYLVLTLGEAAKNIPQEIQAKAPGIPWRAVAASRDRMAHGYFDINLDILWIMVATDIPDLRKALQSLLNAAPDT